MTTGEALQEGRRQLAARAIETPHLDASLLLADAMGATRAHVLASLREPLAEAVLSEYRARLARRAAGEPVAYILGRKEFYGLEFRVDHAVLVPRPETELLVERALAVAPPQSRLHDACTGSGCVAIAVKHERPDLEVSASDLSAAARQVFEANCRSLLGRVLPFVASDLLSSVDGPFEVITANPPYLRTEQVRALHSRGWPEPLLALDGGPEGWEVAVRLIEQAAGRLAAGGWLLLEADPGQMDELAKALADAGFASVERFRDLSGCERVIQARLER